MTPFMASRRGCKSGNGDKASDVYMNGTAISENK